MLIIITIHYIYFIKIHITQVVSKYFLNKYVKFTKHTGIVNKFYKQVYHTNVNTSNNTDDDKNYKLIGNGKNHLLTAKEYKIFQDSKITLSSDKAVQIYKKIIINGDVFHTECIKTYSDDSVCQLKNDVPGCIQKILIISHKIFIIFQIFELSEDPINKYCRHLKAFHRSNKFIVTTPEEVKEKLVVTSTIKKTIISSFPNQIERD